MCRFVRVVQNWRRCHQHSRSRSHNIGATKFGHKPSQRRAWPAMGSVEEGNWIPTDSDSDKSGLMVRSERGRPGRHVMICNVVDANIFGQCWLPAKRVKILFPCDRCVCFFVGIGRALRIQRKVSLFGVVFLSSFLWLVSIYTFLQRIVWHPSCQGSVLSVLIFPDLLNVLLEL